MIDVVAGDTSIRTRNEGECAQTPDEISSKTLFTVQNLQRHAAKIRS
jgi:hypothetical protein